jgi:hypothetical protein
VLPGGCRPLDLRAVLTVRRRKHDRIDRRVGEDLVEIVSKRDPVLGAECLGGGSGSGSSRRKADRAALSLDGIDERAAPTADADDRGADHFFAASMSRSPRNAR